MIVVIDLGISVALSATAYSRAKTEKFLEQRTKCRQIREYDTKTKLGVSPRCHWHGVIKEVGCGTEVDGHGQSNDGCRGRKNTETEKSNNGCLDANVDLDIPKKGYRTG